MLLSSSLKTLNQTQDHVDFLFLSIILIVSHFKCLLINLNEFGVKKETPEFPMHGAPV